MDRIILKEKDFDLNPHYNRSWWSFEVGAPNNDEKSLLQLRDQILKDQNKLISIEKRLKFYQDKDYGSPGADGRFLQSVKYILQEDKITLPEDFL